MSTTSPEPPTTAPAATLVAQTRVLPGHDEEFARWQTEVNDALSHFPGYIDQEVIPPNPPVQVDWVFAQRFVSPEAARAWLQSEQRLRLLDKIQALLVGQDDVHLIADDGGPEPVTPVTVIVSMRVKPGQEAAYTEWQRRVAASEATFPGFSGYRLEPPIPGVQDDWMSMVRFDSDAHLESWLNSEQRQRLLEETPRFSIEFHTRKVRTGFDSWFAADKAAAESPPPWKQNMVVLLTLYPTVFLLGFFVQTPLMLHWDMPFWLSLFLANAVVTALLGWLFVPWASRALNWWLNPKPASASRVNWTGAGLIVALYGLCLLVFSHFPPALIG